MVNRWEPRGLVFDRFREPELLDARPRCPALARVTRYSEAESDIRSFRTWALDGPLSVEAGSAALLGVSIAAAKLAHDDAGNRRLVKRGHNNAARDDCRPCGRPGGRRDGPGDAAGAATRSASMSGRPHWRTWARIRRAALERAGFRCEACKLPGRLEVHHRIPVAAGGTVRP